MQDSNRGQHAQNNKQMLSKVLCVVTNMYIILVTYCNSRENLQKQYEFSLRLVEAPKYFFHLRLGQ